MESMVSYSPQYRLPIPALSRFGLIALALNPGDVYGSDPKVHVGKT